MPVLFTYTDYRLYLRDYYAEKKEASPIFSYRFFARKAGLSSAGLYSRVLSGERNLTEATTEAFIRGLELNSAEAEYFRALVGFNQAESSAQKTQYYAVLISMADFVAHHQLEADEYVYLERWYHPVIRELIALESSNDNWEALGARLQPPLRGVDVQRSAEFLQRMGFIARDPVTHQWVQTQNAVRSGQSQAEVLRQVRRTYHKQMMQLAAESLDRFPVAERTAMSMTLGVSESCRDVILQEMALFQQKIAAIVDKDRGSDRVYQMNLQFFPVALPPGKGSEA